MKRDVAITLFASGYAFTLYSLSHRKETLQKAIHPGISTLQAIKLLM